MFYHCNTCEVQVDVLVDIVKEAGDAILDIYSRDEEEWGAKPKADNSPLTKADLAANKIICDRLRQEYPSIPIISEEEKLTSYDERRDWPFFFLVDPLDGTKEFMKRNGEFTVNIGLCQQGQPVMGVVGVPAAEPRKRYFAVKGGGSYMEDDADRYPGKISVQEFSESDSGLKIVCSRSHSNEATTKFISNYTKPETVSIGSSLKLLLVAEGQAHIYPRLGPTSEWDTCAAQIIVEEAGGRVLQRSGGQPADDGVPVRYNKPNILNPHFVVYGKRSDEEEEKSSSSSSSSSSSGLRSTKTTIQSNKKTKQQSSSFDITDFINIFVPILLGIFVTYYLMQQEGRI